MDRNPDEAPQDSHDLDALIQAARAGSPGELGKLLESFREYLVLIADAELSHDLQAKAGASDLVQETFLEAQRDFAQFQGTTRDEFLAWLWRILLNNVANFRRHFQTSKRHHARERSISGSSAEGLYELMRSNSPSPSSNAARAEETRRLESTLAQLPDEYHKVLHLRHWEQRTFVEIGQLMNRTPNAARMLWWRAFDRLSSILEHDHGPGCG